MIYRELVTIVIPETPCLNTRLNRHKYPEHASSKQYLKTYEQRLESTCLRETPLSVWTVVARRGGAVRPLVRKGLASPVSRAAVGKVTALVAVTELALDASNLAVGASGARSERSILFVQRLGSWTIGLELCEGTSLHGLYSTLGNTGLLITPVDVADGIAGGGGSYGPLVGDGSAFPVIGATVGEVTPLVAVTEFALNTGILSVGARGIRSEGSILVVQRLSSGTILLQV